MSERSPGDDQSSRPRARPLVQRSIVSDILVDPAQRKSMFHTAHENSPIRVVVELNLRHAEGLGGANREFLARYRALFPDKPKPALVSDIYYACRLSMNEINTLVAPDLAESDQSRRAIYRVWPDFPVKALIDQSVSTVKADAARRAYAAAGRGITWAVVDSGIDRRHQHFRTYDTLGGDVAKLHRDFTSERRTVRGALVDSTGHGSHVAGIIAGGLPEQLPDGTSYRIVDNEFDPANPKVARVMDRTVESPGLLAGIARECKLVSLKALGPGSSSLDVVRALEYIRKEINGNGKLMRIHGVNLSIGYEFDPSWYACGQTPICEEVDRLVRSGVVVVVAAGNTGFGTVRARDGDTDVGLTMTINDPGNSRLAITVGSTHRDMPHTYGVSYFSSKGPTGDGRLKPDMVAPGERITSVAAGSALFDACLPDEPVDPAKVAVYVEDSGTSMAAPHVSGVIAAFLSIRREFIGRPEDVKRIFMESATPLGRERYFEGHGLVDLMRAIQSI